MKKTENGNVRVESFVTSLDLSKHPVLNSKSEIKTAYFAVLEHFVNTCSEGSIYAEARLDKYRKALIDNSDGIVLTDTNRNSVIKSIVNDLMRPWRRKYRYWLFCDIALILFDEQHISNAQKSICNYLSKRQSQLIVKLSEAIIRGNSDLTVSFDLTADLIKQYHSNRDFVALPEQRFMVTANMSAGKSTLINALTGKIVSCMKGEAFTASVHYIHDKPFEDGCSSEWDGVLTMDADYRTLMDYDERNLTGEIYAATYFSTFVTKPDSRFCLIDTPGVNSSVNPAHGELTRKILREESFDRLIYVMNGNYLGTDDDLRHLKFIAENVTKDNVIFVINKLDQFKAEDSVVQSVEDVRKSLSEIGFVNPHICPISAYFALLIKNKKNNVALTEDEQDEYELYAKKFSKKEYDLSKYYNIKASGDELTVLAVKSGLLGLEKILYGGEMK